MRKKGFNILYSYAYRDNGWARSMKDYLSGIGLMNIFLDIRTRKLPDAEVFCKEGYYFTKHYLEIYIRSLKDRD